MSSAELRVLSGPDTGRVVELAGTTTVGRDPEADVRLDDQQVSRRHARFVVDNGSVSVEDLGSRNGTLVNGGAISVATPLAAGDRVLLGDTQLEFIPAPSFADELVVARGASAGTVVPIGDSLIVGRDPSCGLVLDDREVSRHHLRVGFTGGRPTVEDLDSMNGTFVNGERILERTVLDSGDRIELGDEVLLFGTERPAAAPERSSAPQVSAARELVAHPGALLTAESGSRKWWTLLVVCLGTFMLLVDVTIVNVAIPTIAEGLDARFTDLVWVVNAYVLGLASLLLICGTIGDKLGHSRVFGIGVVIFTLSSLTCGLANGSSMLIASRAVQGVGGAMMFATALALLSQEFSQRDRVLAFTVWGAVSGGAVAAGPVLGGVLTEVFGWRSIFLFNVPIGVVAIVIVLMRLKNVRPPESAPLDIPGALTLSIGLFLLTLGLATGYSDGWGETHIIGELAAGVIILIAFVVIELNRKQPMVDLSLFRNRSFSGVTIAAFALSASVFALLIYMTIYLQTILGLSALGTGLAFLPMMLLAFAVTGPAGKLVARIPTRWFMVVGLGLVGLGLLLCRGPGDGLTADAKWSHLLPGFIACGIGIGVMTPAMASAALATVGPRRAGMASGMFISSRQIGTALGVAILGAAFQQWVSDRVPDALGAAGKRIPPDALSDAITNGYTPQFIDGSPQAARATIDHAARQVGGETMDLLFISGGVLALVGAVLAFVLISKDAYPVPKGGPPGDGPPPVHAG